MLVARKKLLFGNCFNVWKLIWIQNGVDSLRIPNLPSNMLGILWSLYTFFTKNKKKTVLLFCADDDAIWNHFQNTFKNFLFDQWRHSMPTSLRSPHSHVPESWLQWVLSLFRTSLVFLSPRISKCLIGLASLDWWIHLHIPFSLKASCSILWPTI